MRYSFTWKLKKTVLTTAAVLAIISMTVIFAGCGDTTGDQGTGKNDVANLSFSYAENSDATALDPALIDESVGGNIARYLFEGLVAYNS